MAAFEYFATFRWPHASHADMPHIRITSSLKHTQEHEKNVARAVNSGLVNERRSSLKSGVIVNTPGQLVLLHAWSGLILVVGLMIALMVLCFQ